MKMRMEIYKWGMMMWLREKTAWNNYGNCIYMGWISTRKTLMTSSNGNIFRITGPLCGEFTGHWWIPFTKASDEELWCFSLICAWINGWVNNREAGNLRRHRAHYHVIVMITWLDFIPREWLWLLIHVFIDAVLIHFYKDFNYICWHVKRDVDVWLTVKWTRTLGLVKIYSPFIDSPIKYKAVPILITIHSIKIGSAMWQRNKILASFH